MIKTIEEARDLIKEVKICTIFESDKSPHTSLWEHVDFPDKQPGEKGWGKKMGAVWTWKNRLPAEYPDEIFYGKIKGGFAVLMDMEYLDTHHFEKAYKPIESLPTLLQQIYQKISLEPRETTGLRNEIREATGCSKSQFDTALKNLQITMNIVRSNDPEIDSDTWVPFKEIYLDIWNRHTQESEN
ncbi:MAG: AlkZ-related protein [Opitutales bacterium]